MKIFLKKVFLYILIFTITIELTSLLFIFAHYKIIQKKNSFLNNDMKIKQEIEKVIDSSVFAPHRWYAYLPNFNGNYIKTDSLGFRIDKDKIKNLPSIGFFGGSVMFSVYTKQSETITDQIQINDFNLLNFGMGGYSTAAELPAFIEVQKKYKNIKIAVFFDGVNEVGRFIEFYEEINRNSTKKKLYGPIFENNGYYYKLGIENSINQKYFLDKNKISYNSSFLKLFNAVREKLSFKITYSEAELGIMADNITNLYFKNLEDISDYAESKKIKVIFIFQPTIFTTKKLLTAEETNIIIDNRSIIADLFKITHKKIMDDSRSKIYHIHDFSNSFDDIKDEVFLDWCHLNSIGNLKIAKDMEKILISEIKKNSNN
jgi:hypothetical protein